MRNIVVITGRLCDTPELRTTSNGKEVCSFTLAVQRNYVKGQEPITDFNPCVAWNHNAKFIVSQFTKGQLIDITGKLQSRSYTDKEGNKRKAIEVVIDTVDFVPKDKQPKQEQEQQGDAPSFSNADTGDFEEYDDEEFLPF